VFSGVPATCFATGGNGSLWNSDCAGGKVIKTAREWADAVHAMYPGYTGTYPRMQPWHEQADTMLGYPEHAKEIKQRTALHDLDQTPVSTHHLRGSWTRTRYGNGGAQAAVEGISISGVGHDLPQSGQIQYSIEFLGLNRSGGPAPAVSPPNPPAASSPTPPPGGSSP
jgi:hypothetical protein